MSAGNLRRNLNNLGQDFWQSPTENPTRSTTPTISAFLGGSLSSPGNPAGNLRNFFNLSMQSTILVRQYRQSRQSRATVSAISTILQISAFSAIPAISAVSAVSVGNLRCNLHNLSQDFRQSRTENLALSATPSLSAFLGGSPGNPVRQDRQFS